MMSDWVSGPNIEQWGMFGFRSEGVFWARGRRQVDMFNDEVPRCRQSQSNILEQGKACCKIVHLRNRPEWPLMTVDIL